MPIPKKWPLYSYLMPTDSTTSARHNRLDRWPFILLLLVCIFPWALFGLSAAGAADSGASTYRSTVSEVRLVFYATDQNNRNVQELQASDFAVVDDENVIREFRSVTRSQSSILDVIVLIDASDSVTPRFQEEITSVAQLISQSPWNPGDSISVMSFAGLETRLICADNCQSSFAASQVVPGGVATPLLDAVETAATLLSQRRQPDAWPVIILFSDGNDTISKASFQDVQQTILASGAQVYAVDIGSSRYSYTHNSTMERLAADSGGLCLWLNQGANRIFGNVIHDLHSALVVAYALPQSNSFFHSVRILPTHNLNLQFRCRRGYYQPLASRRREDNP